MEKGSVGLDNEACDGRAWASDDAVIKWMRGAALDRRREGALQESSILGGTLRLSGDELGSV